MIHDTATVVIERDGKFLLTQRAKEPNKGRWEFPGGHVDEGETPKQAAEREMKEEIGDVEIGEEICCFVHTVEKDHHHKCHAFRGVLKGEVRISPEASDFGWFTREEMEKKNVADFTLNIIDNYLGG